MQGTRKPKTQVVIVAFALVVLGGLCFACVLPMAVAGILRPTGGAHGYVADVCIGVRQIPATQVAIGWISSQASATIARPSPYYWRSGFSVCGYVPWTPLLREQGGIVFPA